MNSYLIRTNLVNNWTSDLLETYRYLLDSWRAGLVLV